MFATPGEAGTGGDVDHEPPRASVVPPLLLFKQGAAVQDSIKIYLTTISKDDVRSEDFYLHADIKAEHGRDAGVVDENVDLLLEKGFCRGPDLLPLGPVRHIVLLEYAGVLSEPLGKKGVFRRVMTGHVGTC